MLKIEEFAKTHFGIELTKYQLEIIAIMAADKHLVATAGGRKHGFITARKVAIAYLQDGLSNFYPPVKMSGKFEKPAERAK